MKKLLSLVLCFAVLFGCEDKEKKEHKDCDCHPVAGQEVDGGQEDMGLDAGAQEDQGGEEAGVEDGGSEDGDQGVSDAGEEMPDAGVDCECEGEDCGC